MHDHVMSEGACRAGRQDREPLGNSFFVIVLLPQGCSASFRVRLGIKSSDNCISLSNVHHPRIIIVESHSVRLPSSLNDRTVTQCSTASNSRARLRTVMELRNFIFKIQSIELLV